MNIFQTIALFFASMLQLVGVSHPPVVVPTPTPTAQIATASATPTIDVISSPSPSPFPTTNRTLIKLYKSSAYCETSSLNEIKVLDAQVIKLQVGVQACQQQKDAAAQAQCDACFKTCRDASCMDGCAKTYNEQLKANNTACDISQFNAVSDQWKALISKKCIDKQWYEKYGEAPVRKVL